MEKFVQSYVEFRNMLLSTLGAAAAEFPEDSIATLYAVMLRDTRDREIAQMRNGGAKPQVHPPETTPPVCAVHGVTMKWRSGTSKTSGKPYAFWSCPEKNPDGSYCDYKAPK